MCRMSAFTFCAVGAGSPSHSSTSFTSSLALRKGGRLMNARLFRLLFVEQKSGSFNGSKHSRAAPPSDSRSERQYMRQRQSGPDVRLSDQTEDPPQSQSSDRALDCLTKPLHFLKSAKCLFFHCPFDFLGNSRDDASHRNATQTLK